MKVLFLMLAFAAVVMARRKLTPEEGELEFNKHVVSLLLNGFATAKTVIIPNSIRNDTTSDSDAPKTL